jgi:hypothetical protein
MAILTACGTSGGGEPSAESNNAPGAADTSASTPEDTPITIDVLANSTDVDGDNLLITSVTQSSFGSVVNNGGDITYMPIPNYNGVDSFTYTISDGNGGNDNAIVTVDVTPVKQRQRCGR